MELWISMETAAPLLLGQIVGNEHSLGEAAYTESQLAERLATAVTLSFCKDGTEIFIRGFLTMSATPIAIAVVAANSSLSVANTARSAP